MTIISLKSDGSAPRTTTGYPHEGPFVGQLFFRGVRCRRWLFDNRMPISRSPTACGESSEIPVYVDTTRGPSWGHHSVVLGAIMSFLEPFCGYLSPKIEKVSLKLTFEYPHEGPCVERVQDLRRFSSSFLPSSPELSHAKV